MKRILAFVFMLGVGYAMPATATPLAPAGLETVVRSALSDSLVEVHDWHRACVRGYVRRWRDRAWHEHHRNGRVSNCRPRRHYRRDDDRHHHYRHRGGCIVLGGVKICS